MPNVMPLGTIPLTAFAIKDQTRPPRFYLFKFILLLDTVSVENYRYLLGVE